jgi:hypothetical protein
MSPVARILVAGLVVTGLVALAALGWRANLLGVRTEPALGSVATAFDPTPTYPGYTWARDGRSVSEFELVTIAGPAHCGWESATFLFIGWPPGTVAPNASQARQYIRDPRGVIQGPYRDLLEREANLPSDARSTGYRLGAIELYVSPSDQDQWIYLGSASNVERWPRSNPMTLCA